MAVDPAWISAAAGLGGALIGAGTAMAVDHVRWKRGRATRWEPVKIEAYEGFLSAVRHIAREVPRVPVGKATPAKLERVLAAVESVLELRRLADQMSLFSSSAVFEAADTLALTASHLSGSIAVLKSRMEGDDLAAQNAALFEFLAQRTDDERRTADEMFQRAVDEFIDACREELDLPKLDRPAEMRSL